MPHAPARIRLLMIGLLSLVPLAPSGAAHGAVGTVVFADVTPRSFAAVWESAEPVISATVSVYEDPAGAVERTSALVIRTESLEHPPALDLGIVKVTVEGLGADACVYVQAVTVTAAGVHMHPAGPPFREVCMASRAMPARPDGSPIANDVLDVPVAARDGVAPPIAALVLVGAPARSEYPLSAFAEPSGDVVRARVDLNNLYEAATGSTVDLADSERLVITEIHGDACPFGQHRLTRYRAAPRRDEPAEITEIEAPVLCGLVDANCDGLVGVMDFQRVLKRVGARLGDCVYDADVDLFADGFVDALDLQLVVDQFGETIPIGD